MSAYCLASILVVGLVQVCFAVEVKQLAANHKTYFARQMFDLATGGFKADAITVPSPLPENNTYSETGFFYLTNSYDSDCSNTVIDYGVPVDHCMIDVGFAYKFQLTQDSCVGGIVEYYRDELCTIKAGTSDLEPVSSNCSVAENPVIVGDQPVYSMLMCTTSPVPRMTVDAGVMETFVNNTECDTSGDYTFVSYASGQCITINGTTFTVSCQGDAVVWNLDLFDGVGDCQGDLYPFMFPDTCVIQEPYSGNDDDDMIYNPAFIQPPPSVSTTPFPTSMQTVGNDSQITYCQYAIDPSAEPTAEPTVSPTSRKPTRMPTAKPSTAYPTSATVTTVSFKATQVVSGISLDTYNSNPTLYGNTLKQTIAQSMIGVTADNILNLVATAATTSSIQQVTAGAAKLATGVAAMLKVKVPMVRSSLRTVMASSAISITYTVQVSTQLTTTDLEAQLTSSVDSGVFTAMLQTNAGTNGATGLEGASSAAVTTTSVDNGGGSDSGLSDGAIVGIVIGCVAGVAIIGVLVYFFAFSKKSLLNSPNVEL